MIQGNTVRIAAVAAFLVCSLLGRPLHELQHHAEALPGDEKSEHSSAEVSCKAKSKACPDGHKCHGGSHSQDVNVAQSGTTADSHGHGTHGHEPEGDHPGHSHDSHDCSVCQALCVSATTPNCTSACLRSDVCVGRYSIFSESAAASASHAADARGPPCLG